MPRLISTLQACAELGRISNLPTTFTNVLAGCAAGASGLEGMMDWRRILAAWGAVACFYLAGMALNDVVDAPIDRTERPRRPIPSGRISLGTAICFAIILLGIGLGILSAISPRALAMGGVLTALIIAYDLLHARFAAAVILMGLCRGMVYVIGAAAIFWPPQWTLVGTLATALTAYTVVFSIIARSENRTQLDHRRWLAILLPLIAVAPLLVLRPTEWPWIILALAILMAWLWRAAALVFTSPPRTKAAVQAWLSGFCLVDVFYLTLLDRPMLALIAGACFALTIVAQRRIAGT